MKRRKVPFVFVKNEKSHFDVIFNCRDGKVFISLLVALFLPPSSRKKSDIAQKKRDQN